MKYSIRLELPQGWKSSVETSLDPDGTEITHLSAYLSDEKAQADISDIDIYLGDMPADGDAQEQAMLNYVDMVGFDEDDPEDQDPLTVWPFSGKKAYGFECLCEDDSPMRVMFCELKKGLLAIISVVAKDDATLAEYVTMVEQRLRVKSVDKLEQQ